jgi:general secretion pathway protein D
MYKSFLWVLLILIASCKSPYQDQKIRKTREDFAALSSPAPPPSWGEQQSSLGACLPEEALPDVCHKKTSLSLSGTMPVQDVFFEIARQSGASIVFDQPLSFKKSILYHAEKQPLHVVLKALCGLCHLRYYCESDTIHITEDEIYMKVHNVQFLLGTRQAHKQTAVKTDILAQGLSGKSGQNFQENGASMQLKSSNTIDFWEELEKNLKYILKEKEVAGKKVLSYSLNRYAGLLSVWGTEKQHKILASYLSHLQKLATTQVLIEAKIVEVDLAQGYESGIKWDTFFSPFGGNSFNKTDNTSGDIPSNAPQTLGGLSLGGLAPGNFSFWLNGQYLNGLLKFMESFGTVRTLANLRQTVLNNQSAILKVASNEIFFEIQMDDIIGNYSRPSMIRRSSSRVQTVPVGVILYVQPSVNFETGEIILALHPMISRVVRKVADPAVALAMEGGAVSSVQSEIPVVQVREMDSVVVARENTVIVTGGLMEERVRKHTEGIPLLSDIPVLGELFKKTSDETNLSELVILLKLSLVKGVESVSPADQRLYHQFTKDPRPVLTR